MLKENKKLIGAILLVIIIALIMTILGRGKADDNLASYTQTDRVETVDGTTSTSETKIDTFIYTDSENNFSVSIPKDWKQATEGNIQSFVHQATGTAVLISVLDYDSSVNNQTAETLAANITQNGYTYVNYNKVSNSQYELIYQDMKNSTYDYLEEVYWDRTKIIKMLFVTNDEYYDTMLPYFQEIMNSFVWSKTSEIPEGYYIYYNESGDFELLVPDSWTTGTSSNALVGYDENSGASFTVTLNEYSDKLSNITATDIVNLYKGSKDNFIMSQYNTSEKEVTAKATYISDNVQMTEEIYMFTNGKYLCSIVFDYEAGTIDESLCSTCGSYFRFINNYFETADTNSESIEETSTVSETAESSEKITENSTNKTTKETSSTSGNITEQTSKE